MNEDKFNMEIRKFLKHVGITSQREIEHTVLKKIADGSLGGGETFDLRMTLEVSDLAINKKIEGKIRLE